MLYLKLAKTYQKIRKRELNVPNSIEEKFALICQQHNIQGNNSDTYNLLEESIIILAYQKQYQRHFPITKPNYEKGLFSNDSIDWALLMYLVGKFVPEIKYKLMSCNKCNILLTDSHLINDCYKYESKRINLLIKCRKLGIIWNNLTLTEVIQNLQYNCEISKIDEAKKSEVLIGVKFFLHEIRESYLEELENSKQN